IKDLEAKVKEGEVLINNKDWVAAYNYFQKLRPYEDTVSAIGSNYRKAKDEIIDSYVNAAKVDEKNFDFVSAKKEYEKALAYDQKDKSLNRKIKEVTERIGAQEMLAKGKALSDQGQKEKAFEMLKDAHKKDEDNKEITIYMNVLKDDVAKLWMDRAIDLEAKGQYKDAYSTVVKAEEVGSDMKDVKAGIETAKKSIILNYARSFAEKADGLKNNDEEAYIYYIASYALNSEDKAVQDKIKGLEQTLKDKTCYNLGIRTTVSPKTKMDKDTLSKVDEMIKTELGSFAKDKCINIAEPTKGDQGYLLNTVLTYKSETKGSMITIKLDLESEATDLATKKGLAKTRKMDLYAGEAAKTNEVKVEDDMVNKVVRNVVSELKDSNLRYYGDRYYTFFNTAKDPRSKMSNAVLTFIAKRYLSDERLFSDNAVKYITKTYGVNIDRKRMETLDKSK
ncbi:MAG: hypothetical protein WCQ53_03685, partial [bacterium]